MARYLLAAPVRAFDLLLEPIPAELRGFHEGVLGFLQSGYEYLAFFLGLSRFSLRFDNFLFFGNNFGFWARWWGGGNAWFFGVLRVLRFLVLGGFRLQVRRM